MNENNFQTSAYTQIRSYVLTVLTQLGISRILIDIIFIPADFFVFLWRAFRNNQLTLWIKLEIILALLYFLVPNDLIPDYIGGLGIIDDILIFMVVSSNLFYVLKLHNDNLLFELWPGNDKLFRLIDKWISYFGKWSRRLVVILTIGKLGMIVLSTYFA